MPADSKTPLYGQRGYNAWIQAMYAEAWRAHGKHDPRWDAEAAKLIDDYVLPERFVPKKELVTRGRKLLADGCDDPLIRFVVGGSLDLEAGNSVYQAIEVLKPALDQLPPDYTPDVAYRVELRFIEAWDRAYPRKPKESSDVVERMLGRIKRIVAGPLTNEDRRRQFQRLIHAVHGPLNRYLTRFYPNLAASDTTDRWLLQVLLARTHIDLAWRERGGGWASEVKPEGWEGFEKHLTKARSLLLQAWKEHPELPEAARFLIMVTMASGGAAGEDARFWFDRAVAVDFDYVPAYEALAGAAAMKPCWRSVENVWRLNASIRRCPRNCIGRFAASFPNQTTRSTPAPSRACMKIIRPCSTGCGPLPKARAGGSTSTRFARASPG